MASKPKQRPEENNTFRWLQEPGIYCDTYTVDLWKRPGVVRMTFGEYTDQDHSPFYRVAVVMPKQDVKALIATLTRILKEEDEQEEKSATSTSPKPE